MLGTVALVMLPALPPGPMPPAVQQADPSHPRGMTISPEEELFPQPRRKMAGKPTTILGQ